MMIMTVVRIHTRARTGQSNHMIAGGERRLAARTTFEFTFSPNRMNGCVVIAAREAEPSTDRNNDFPFGASAFDVGQRFSNFRQWIRSVDDGLQLSLLDEFGKQSKLATAWMHKEIAIADACAAGPRSDAVADEPEDGGKSSAAA